MSEGENEPTNRRPIGLVNEREVRRFTFVRHGESTYNVAGRWQGHGDAPLSDLGKEQAQALAARLGAEVFDLLVSSDLSRALDTGRALGAEVETDPQLREIDVGAWEGLTRDEVFERFPKEVAALRRGERIPVGGAESWDDVYSRAKAAVDELREKLGPGGHAAVFSHGGWVSTLFTGIFGVRKRHPRPIGHLLNTSISTVAFGEDGAIVERYNDATHHPSVPSWVPSRFPRGATRITFLSHGPVFRIPDDADEEMLEHFFGEVRLVIATDEESEATALTLGSRLGAEVTTDPYGAERMEELAQTHPGGRVLVLTSPEAIRKAARLAVGIPEATPVDFAPPPVGTLTHVVRTRYGLHLGDYAIGPLPFTPEAWPARPRR